MPGVDEAVYGHKYGENVAFLNVGGISNISIPNEKLGFDIGPGNCLIDLGEAPINP